MFLLFGLACAVAVLAASWISPGGSGSYGIVVPAVGAEGDVTCTCTVPAIGPNSSASGSRKAPTNDWWTPLVWLDPHDTPSAVNKLAMCPLSWRVFADPLVIQPQRGGLAIGYNIPDSMRSGDSGGLNWSGAGFMQMTTDTNGLSPFFNAFFDQDLYAGSTISGWQNHGYDTVTVTGWSDWFVNFDLRATGLGESLTVTAGNGSPLVLIRLQSGSPQVTFRNWNVGKVVPLTGNPVDINAGCADSQTFRRAFALINYLPYPAADHPAGSKAYNLYTIYACFLPAGETWTLSKYAAFDTSTAGPFAPWHAGTAYLLGNPVEPSAANGFFYTANKAGTTGGSEPAWPTTAGQTVVDGTVTWLCNSKIQSTPYNSAIGSGGRHYAVAVLPYAWPKGIYDQPDWQQVQRMLNFYDQYAFSEVTNTAVTPDYQHGPGSQDVSATYAFTTRSVSGETARTGTLFALYPHQFLDQTLVRVLNQTFDAAAVAWGNLMPSTPANTWWWPTLKGPMLLAAGSSFTNRLTLPPVLPATITVLNDTDAASMVTYLAEAQNTQNPWLPRKGSYFGAQMIYRQAQLLPLCQQLINGQNAIDTGALATLQRAIYDSAVAQFSYRLRAVTETGSYKNAAQHVLYYEPRWGSLIPAPEDGFAADMLLNDHHFHYGYWVKIAAELARYEKQHLPSDTNGFARQYAPLLKLIIKDYANWTRTPTGTDPDFPFLRNFTPYMGHSIASGSSRGDQGGQQESSSEAVQAYAALLLWSQLNFPADPDNGELEKWAAYLTASEALAARLYWFGFCRNEAWKPYISFRQYARRCDSVPVAYIPPLVSQVNQNELTFQTDFDPRPLAKYAIQWLPLTGSSFYLAERKSDIDENLRGYYDTSLPRLKASGTPLMYKDILRMFEAMSDSYQADARALVARGASGVRPLDDWYNEWAVPGPEPDTKLFHLNSRASVFWWIKTWLNNGLSYEAAQAYYSGAVVTMDENGNPVYVAYNPDEDTTTVEFSDGTTLVVPPLSYATSTGAPAAGSACLLTGFSLRTRTSGLLPFIRSFRDHLLLLTPAGRALAGLYYLLSPFLIGAGTGLLFGGVGAGMLLIRARRAR